MSASPAPLVSVVVPVWNGARDIARCLDALGRQTLDRTAFEVIVVDNASSDGTADAVRRFGWATLLQEPQPGSYRARNRGLVAARGEHVMFTDADCTPDVRWIEAALAAARAHPSAGVVAGRIALASESDRTSPVCEAWERLFAFNQAKNVANGVAVTANWLSPRALVVAAGGFRAELKSGGDHDLARRLREAGHALVYAPDMLVTHPVRATVPELMGKTRRIVGGRMTARRRRGGLPAWMGVLAVDAARRVKVILAADGTPPLMKARLVTLSLLLFGGATAEAVRVAAGGEPRRA